MDLKENQTLKHSSTQTKTYCLSPGVNLLNFLLKNNRSNGLHIVSMENDALQKLSLFMTTTKKNYKIGNGPAAVLEISPR